MKVLLIIVFSLFSTFVSAKCHILSSNKAPATSKADVLFKILSSQSECPTDVLTFKDILKKEGLLVKPSMVANRGRHNPSQGSFSFFESVTGRSPLMTSPINEGDFFFGHFTLKSKNTLILDQAPQANKLLIELIVWDPQKGLFNFYELIGTSQSANWFYRGDSLDALADNAFVHRSPKGAPPKFGNRMRCSACHSSGGPIMKEITYPHNDWWTQKRPLDLGEAQPSIEVSAYLKDLMSAEKFASQVLKGIVKLENSPSLQRAKSSLSLQERLRPIFCENEINIESDLLPHQNHSSSIKVPSASLLNPYLGSQKITLSKGSYLSLLKIWNMRFPENNQLDADHPWLTPVKGVSDLMAIHTLIKTKSVDHEFVIDVLSLDFKKPLFSKDRCELLKLLPSSASNWKNTFISNLEKSNAPLAQELFLNLTAPERNLNWHAQRIHDYFSQLPRYEELFLQLLQTRNDLFKSEISKNPMGQILEPGFRVIFPTPIR